MSTPSEATVFEARYADGRSAAARRVAVAFESTGLVVTEMDGSGSRSWPYTKLATATPISPKAVDVLVRLDLGAPKKAATAEPAESPAEDEDGATLFVDDKAFTTRLAVAAPHLTSRRERWRFLVPGLVVMAMALAAMAVVWLADLTPARSIASIIPDRVWHLTGDRVFLGVTQGHKTCTDGAGRQAIDRMMTKLSLAAGARQPFDVRVVDWELLNAFALPGRRIVLTRKLLTSVGSADELAGVVAHEIGHGLELHPEASIVRLLGLTTLGKVLLSGAGDNFASLGVLLVQLGYSREAERQADARAVTILRQAGIPARSLATFFDRVKKTKDEGGILKVPATEIFNTHPSLDERMRALENAPTYPTAPALTSDEFAALQKMCGPPTTP